MRVSLKVAGVLAAAYFCGAHGHWVIAAGLILVTTVLVERLEGPPEQGATAFAPISTRSLTAQGSPATWDLPLYVAGIGRGILPAHDWFTAQMDGRQVLILEAVDEEMNGQDQK